MSDTIPHHPTRLGDQRRPAGDLPDPGCVRVLEPSFLPRVAAADFGAARTAAVRFGKTSRSLKLTLAPFGDLLLTLSNPAPAQAPAMNDAVFRLRRGHEHGWLVVDGLAGLRVVATVIGLPTPRILRAMSAAERGVLAAVVASVVRASPGTRVATSTNGEWNGMGLARFDVAAECEILREHCFLDVPPTWLPCATALDGALATMRQHGLRFTLSLERARTTISAEEWSRARPGDTVVFDEPAGIATDLDRRARATDLVLGAYAAAARIVAEGQVRVDEPFRKREPRPRSAMSHDPTQKFNYGVLASAPIEIVAELGRVVLRADEVVALQPGSILTFVPASPATVELRVGDRPWAVGELVNVDGHLGVRVVAVAPPPSEANASIGDADTLPR